jgi:hypothetical protein
MHLIIIIALGVFGGLWLFTRWAEWREARIERRKYRDFKRQYEAEAKATRPAPQPTPRSSDGFALSSPRPQAARQPRVPPKPWMPWVWTATKTETFYAVATVAGFLWLMWAYS